MKQEHVRFMWVFCFFDLPVKTPQQRRRANRFRNHLKNDGFFMMQFSVYARLAKGQEGVDKHIKRVKAAIPSEGSVRCLQVTDKQFGRMKIMIGNASKTEKKTQGQLVLL